MKRPASAKARLRTVERLLDGFARTHDVPKPRARQWVSYMIVAGALDRARHHPTTPGEWQTRFVIKGGVALELRLHAHARATADLDVVADGVKPSNLLDAFEQAVVEPYEGFAIRRKGEPFVMRNGTIRLKVAMTYGDAPWATVAVDLSPGEGSSQTEVEMVDAVSLTALGLSGPAELPCLSLRYQAAQKIHAVTKPGYGDEESERYRDLVDLQLLAPLVKLPALGAACRDVFQTRQTHSWPPTFAPPAAWAAPFTRLAMTVGVRHSELSDATAWLGDLIGALT